MGTSTQNTNPQQVQTEHTAAELGQTTSSFVPNEIATNHSLEQELNLTPDAGSGESHDLNSTSINDIDASAPAANDNAVDTAVANNADASASDGNGNTADTAAANNTDATALANNGTAMAATANSDTDASASADSGNTAGHWRKCP